MNYYEELGIRPDADEEEIRKAHRRLVKIMHPDQHRDQQMKQLAETQMRRLNSIVATLLDPEERQDYDEQLRGGSDSNGAAPQQSTWRSVPWWIASTLGAIVLTVGAVWFWADRMGSHPNYNPPEVTNSESSTPTKEDSTTVRVPMTPPHAEPPPVTVVATPPPPVPDQKPASSTVAVVPEVPKPKPAEIPKNPFPAAPLPVPASKVAAKTPADLPPHPKESAPLGTPHDKVAKETRPTVPPAPKTATSMPTVMPAARYPKIDGNRKYVAGSSVISVQPPKKTSLDASLRPPSAITVPVGDPEIDIPLDHGSMIKPPPMHSKDPLEGEWVYAPSEPEKHKAGLYPPEFIQLKLIKQDDGMRGEYKARYNVADNRPVSPNVNFALKSVDKTSLKYVWTAADGSHGTFVIRSLEPDTMRLEWRQTSGRSGPALTSGMATLVRKN